MSDYLPLQIPKGAKIAIGIVVLGFCIMISSVCLNIKPSIAQGRSQYMDRGDRYLTQADNCMLAQTQQAYAIQALACYTAALNDK